VVSGTTAASGNHAPVLDPISDQWTHETQTLTFVASATDSDVPPNTLTFSLLHAPAGASINASSGIFTWTPTESQGPGSYNPTVRVTDNGSPTLYDEEAINITVNEINVAPVLAAIGNKSVNAGQPLTFTASATDSDIPANALTFSLLNAPSGASINAASGVFTWTPAESQGPGSYSFDVVVTDDGTPALSDAETITVTITVNEANVAQGATASQSSTYGGAAASQAVDGDTTGAWSSNSLSCTTSELNAWWQVDLGGLYEINVMDVWNRTDGCQDRLADFSVFVSDVPFTSNTVAGTLAQDGVWSRHVVIPGGPRPDVSLWADTVGRYVRIQLGDTDYLTLAEVQVFGQAVTLGDNVAEGKLASQSGTYPGPIVASRAVDGNTNGTWPGGSLSCTTNQFQPWWQEDLGEYASGAVADPLYQINAIDVWNRTDGCQDRLDDFYVFVSDVPFTSNTVAGTLAQDVVWSRYVVIPGGPRADVSLSVDAVGRYVRIQLMGTNYLTLAEVQVFGEAVTFGDNVAEGKYATQSSTYAGAVGSRAVDGNTSGQWADGSLSCTRNDVQAWWEVDLGRDGSGVLTDPLYQIDAIRVWNRTDGCQDRLDDFYVFVSDVPFTSNTLAGTLAQDGVWSRHVVIPGGARPDVSVAVDRVGWYVLVQLADTNYLTLAEVWVIGEVVTLGDNVAQGKVATQSSTYAGAAASRAVDGNTNGAWSSNSLSCTTGTLNAWWQVDLGGSCDLNAIEVWNRTDGCQDRLDDLYVFVSDVPFASNTVAGTLAQDGIWSRHVVVPGGPRPNVSLAVDAVGRYVRIQLAGTNYLTLAEVKVFGQAVAVGSNVAQGQTATQSSTYAGAAASRAVNGDTNGVWSGNSLSCTASGFQPWWQVDLGGLHDINAIDIWNRTDGCQDRLDDFYVFVSDTPFTSNTVAGTLAQEGIWSRHVVGIPSPVMLMWAETKGRYIRIQLADTNYLTLAEVQVLGTPLLLL
jgi:hypothetical protein